MTFLVSIHAKSYALMAADKMEVAKIGSQYLPVSSHVDKIINTGIGLMTGSGYVTLLDLVKSAVSQSEITNTDQILDIIKEKRLELLNTPYLSDAEKTTFLGNTGWLFTYNTIVDGARAIRAAMFFPNLSEEYLGLMEENKCFAIFPSDATAEVTGSFTATLKREMVSVDSTSNNFQDSLAVNVQLILRLMKEMSEISSFVSEYCDIGLELLDGTTAFANDISTQTPSISFKPFP